MTYGIAKQNKNRAGKAYIIYVSAHSLCPPLNSPETLMPFIKEEKHS